MVERAESAFSHAGTRRYVDDERGAVFRDLGQAHHLTDDQLVELVATFCLRASRMIKEKVDRRTAGQNGDTEKTTYPYEVLSENTGVCQDKSYLAYRLLQELGYGVALFFVSGSER